MKRTVRLILVPSVLLTLACGSGGGTDTKPSPVLASITLAGAPADGRLAVPQSVNLTATGRDSAGSLMSGLPYTWSSSNPAAIAVEATTGKATAIAPGEASLTARSGAVTSPALVLTAFAPGPTPLEQEQCVALTRNLMKQLGFVGAPGSPVFFTRRGALQLPRPAAMDECGTLTTDPAGGSYTLDFTGCSALRGRIQCTYTVDADLGTVDMVFRFVGFGYDFALEGQARSFTLDGLLQVEGLLSDTATLQTYLYTVTTDASGLTCRLSRGGVTDTWIQTLQLSSTQTFDQDSGIAIATYYGSGTLTGAASTYRLNIPSNQPLRVDLNDCPHPRSGLIQWSARDAELLDLAFGLPCGTATLQPGGTTLQF